MIELNETHAPLGQPAGQQTVGRERAIAALRAVQVEHRASARRTGPSVPARSSASGRPSRTGRCAWRFPGRPRHSSWSLLSCCTASDDVALLLSVVTPAGLVTYRTGSPLERNSTPWNWLGRKPLCHCREADRLGLAEAAQRGQHHEAGQVVALAAQAVQQPRTHARPAGDGRAGVHERVGRIVVDRLGHHRADDAQVVGDRRQAAGRSAQISCPLLPNFLNGMLRGRSRSSFAPCSWAIGCPLVYDSGIGLPFIAASFGLWSASPGAKARRPCTGR